MAQLLGPSQGSRLVVGDIRGGAQTFGGHSATVYTDAAATTSLAAINTYDGTGTPAALISGSVVTVGNDGRLPQFWFPDGVDTLYVRVGGRAGVWSVNADFDARLDTLAGMTQAAAVVDAGALTSAQITGGESPTEAEYNALQTDAAATRTKLNALLGSLRTAGIIHA